METRGGFHGYLGSKILKNMVVPTYPIKGSVEADPQSFVLRIGMNRTVTH